MNMTPEKYVQRLIDASHKKYKLLEDILRLTKEQSSVINEDGIDNLNRIIEEKQNNIDQIDKLDEEFNVYFQRLKSELKVNTLDEIQGTNIEGIKELKDCTKGIIDIIGEISKLEQENNSNAKNLLEDLGKEIKKLNQGKKVNTVYSAGPGQAPSYFIDKKK